MPKIKPSNRCRLRAYVQEFGENIFSTYGNILFCKVCEVKVVAEKKFTITQHMSRDKHLRALVRKKEKEDNEKTQMFLNTTTNNSFNLELCYMIISANIPISKLKHPDVCNFLF
uniref:CGG triplet repeat-binding protein 1 n=1 Tax=Sipha flava TaxID=143950 RepID=A0A2S2PVS2_9HEMI